MGFAQVYGILQNASEATPSSMPCFSGFGLPLCTELTGGQGWQSNWPPGYSLRDGFLCLQCCRSDRDFFDTVQDRWALRCTPGIWEIQVPLGTPAQGTFEQTNPFTAKRQNVTVPAGVGAAQIFRVPGVPLPPRSALDRWEFRFMRKETQEDARVVSCPLARANASSYIAGYSLRLVVSERRSGFDSWVGVESCSAAAIETAAPPAFLTEEIEMTNAPAGMAAGSSAVGILVVVAVLVLAIGGLKFPSLARRMRWPQRRSKVRARSDEELEVQKQHDRVNHR